MREPVTATRLERFMRELAATSRGSGRVYLTGGASAVLLGWRDSTVDVDIKILPEDDRVPKERCPFTITISTRNVWRRSSAAIARIARTCR